MKRYAFDAPKKKLWLVVALVVGSPIVA